MMNEKWKYCDRREFMKTAGMAGAGLLVGGVALGGCKSGFTAMAAENKSGIRKSAEHSMRKGLFAARGGDDPYKLTVAAMTAAGGMGALVKKGQTVVIKPNIAWDRTVEQAGNTNPQVVAALIHLALAAGAGKVKVLDRTCNEAKKTYRRSGIEKAATEAGAEVLHATDDMFVSVQIPDARVLKEWLLCRDMLEADVLIDVPIVKHHGATGMTASLKNLMGTAGGERGLWHVATLDQRIADVYTALRPDLVVTDAFRILMDHGPQGGSLDDVKQLSTVAVSTDAVASDSYAAKLFGVKAADIKHIKFAHEMGLGEIDLANVAIHEQSV